MASSIAIYAAIITIIIIGFVMIYVGADTDSDVFKCAGIVAMLLGLALCIIPTLVKLDNAKTELQKLNHDICEELETEQREEIGLKEEAQQDIKDGYTVYVDCKKVDSKAVDFDWSTYKVDINDKTKTVYLEKKVSK